MTRRKSIWRRLLRSTRAATGRIWRACVATGTTCLRTAVRRLRRSGPTVIVDVRRRQARHLRREVARAARTYARALGAEIPPRLLVVVQRVVYEGRQLNGLLQAFDAPDGSRRYVLHLALSINGRQVSEDELLAALERRIRGGEELTLARLVEEFPCGLKGERAAEALAEFLEVIRVLQAMAEGPPGLLIDAVLEISGYRAWLRAQEDGEKRLANLEAFHALAERSDAQDLAEFLDEVSLAADLDTGSDPEGLALSTIHAAKGLEWPVVFVAGLEEGLLPHARALDGLEGEGSPLEEELRLCYVAATRAVDRLYLTYASRRPGHGQALSATPSRFLRGIPAELVERRVA